MRLTRRVRALATATRAGARDAANFNPAIEDQIKDAPEKIAWMRLLSADGKVIAAAGNLQSAPKWTADALRTA